MISKKRNSNTKFRKSKKKINKTKRNRKTKKNIKKQSGGNSVLIQTILDPTKEIIDIFRLLKAGNRDQTDNNGNTVLHAIVLRATNPENTLTEEQLRPVLRDVLAFGPELSNVKNKFGQLPLIEYIQNELFLLAIDLLREPLTYGSFDNPNSAPIKYEKPPRFGVVNLNLIDIHGYTVLSASIKKFSMLTSLNDDSEKHFTKCIDCQNLLDEIFNLYSHSSYELDIPTSNVNGFQTPLSILCQYDILVNDYLRKLLQMNQQLYMSQEFTYLIQDFIHFKKKTETTFALSNQNKTLFTIDSFQQLKQEIVRYIQKFINFNHMDIDGFTPLMYTVMNHNPLDNTVSLYGSMFQSNNEVLNAYDILFQDNEVFTSHVLDLLNMCEYEDQDIFNALLQKMLHLPNSLSLPNHDLNIPNNINSTNKFGQTALHIAAYYGNVTILNDLLEKDSDPFIKDNGLKTPLQIAIQASNQMEGEKMFDENEYIDVKEDFASIVEILLSYGQQQQHYFLEGNPVSPQQCYNYDTENNKLVDPISANEMNPQHSILIPETGQYDETGPKGNCYDRFYLLRYIISKLAAGLKPFDPMNPNNIIDIQWIRNNFTNMNEESNTVSNHISELMVFLLLPLSDVNREEYVSNNNPFPPVILDTYYQTILDNLDKTSEQIQEIYQEKQLIQNEQNQNMVLED